MFANNLMAFFFVNNFTDRFLLTKLVQGETLNRGSLPPQDYLFSLQSFWGHVFDREVRLEMWL